MKCNHNKEWLHNILKLVMSVAYNIWFWIHISLCRNHRNYTCTHMHTYVHTHTHTHTLWTALQIPLWSKSHWIFHHKVYKIALGEVLATQMGVTEAQHQSQLIWIVQIWPIFTSQWVDSAGTCTYLCFGLLVSCYSLLQHSRPAWLELFVDHTHTHSMNKSKMATTLTPQTDVTSEKVTWLMENPRQKSGPAYRI